MNSFQQQINKDLNNVFFNSNEFAEAHIINRKTINIIVDNDRLIHRSKKEFDGMSVGEILIFVKVDDLDKTPVEGSPMIFDNRQMYVFSVREDNGLYEIILSQNIGV